MQRQQRVLNDIINLSRWHLSQEEAPKPGVSPREETPIGFTVS